MEDIRMPEQQTSQDLIHTIEARDRRYRIAWVISALAIIIALIVVVIMQYRNLEKQEDGIEKIKADNADQYKKISDQIDCIADFFAERDRDNKLIDDLEKCNISQYRGNKKSQKPTDSASTTPSPTASEPLGTKSNKQHPKDKSKLKDPGNGPDERKDPPPVDILGVPLCVPLTDTCVREQ